MAHGPIQKNKFQQIRVIEHCQCVIGGGDMDVGVEDISVEQSSSPSSVLWFPVRVELNNPK